MMDSDEKEGTVMGRRGLCTPLAIVYVYVSHDHQPSYH